MSLSVRRFTTSSSNPLNPHSLLKACSSSSMGSIIQNEDQETKKNPFSSNKSKLNNLLPLLSGSNSDFKSCKIELVDDETWQVSRGWVKACQEKNGVLNLNTTVLDIQSGEKMANYAKFDVTHDPDFDEIEDMRIRGNLFYKIDRNSKEFEEYSLDFHRRKSSKNGNKGNLGCDLGSKIEKSGEKEKKRKEENSTSSLRETEKKQNPKWDLASKIEKHGEKERKRKEENMISSLREMENKEENPSCDLASKLIKNGKKEWKKAESLIPSLHEMKIPCFEKKQRAPTFNQLTSPYHEPFCLDICISKASIRACIVHRATSKVVSVAHSISKDMKFDLTSTKNLAACAAVGEALAQRALADDIHNAIYTPRKGERLEGKLRIVLKSIVKNGIDVKVKIKKRKEKKRYGLLGMPKE